MYGDESVDMKAMHETHLQMIEEQNSRSTPTLPGQDAFGAIQEIVQILEREPNTDWNKVDLEKLRQHLIDMNEVILRSEVKSRQIPSGLSMEIIGKGRTEEAIQSMVVPHTAILNEMPQWLAEVEKVPGGVHLIVKTKDPNDSKTLAKIRGLGFIGLLVQGAHHQPHHLAMAKGENAHDHHR
ncbi:MAG: hypothetical protein HY036_03610 [Nitrospirae bacterium]|nr:hypothetical protein [Nitrospirota bacterium]